MCCRRLIVEGDSLTVIKNIQKKGNDNSVISSITHHIYNLGMSFETVSYLAVPREANEAAHALAIEGKKQKELSFFYFGNEFGSSKGSSLIILGLDLKGKESVADIGTGFLLVVSRFLVFFLVLICFVFSFAGLQLFSLSFLLSGC
ncbi:hypothetical protein Gotur_035596 [Gossypium turneri]